MTDSPLLSLPGAVAGSGVDAPVAAHYGGLHTEQRTLDEGSGFVDLSHRGVFRLTGPDRLTWLHDLTTQFFRDLAPGVWTQALLLSPQGHVEHGFTGRDDGEAFTAFCEPGTVSGIVEFLERMKFLTRVEIEDVTADLAVTWRPRSGAESPDQWYDLVPRAELSSYAAAAGPAAGQLAYDALRIARGEPRIGVDTDHKAIPNELGLLGVAVHLDKGCYRGQETVARIHTLGRPPRRLTLLHLDGTENHLPAVGSALATEPGGRPVGVVGSSGRHHELGPIALALVKRSVPVDAQLTILPAAEGDPAMPAAQEVILDPEIGLHVRPKLR